MRTTLKTLPADAVRSSMRTPVGLLWIIASERGLHAVVWPHALKTPASVRALAALPCGDDHPTVALTRRQLAEYFAGARARFDLPLRPAGTPFQLRAWRALARIPYGATVSYQAQAEGLGGRRLARAVGAANAQNPLAIVVPCHRVVAKSGALAGFGGGVANKRLLLDLERCTPAALTSGRARRKKERKALRG